MLISNRLSISLMFVTVFFFCYLPDVNVVPPYLSCIKYAMRFYFRFMTEVNINWYAVKCIWQKSKPKRKRLLIDLFIPSNVRLLFMKCFLHAMVRIALISGQNSTNMRRSTYNIPTRINCGELNKLSIELTCKNVRRLSVGVKCL